MLALISRRILALTILLSALTANAGELLLSTPLLGELNQVLRASDNLHKSLISQNEEQIEMSIRDMVFQLEKARMASQQAKPHERQHLVRIIEAAREQFELTQSAFGQERRDRLEEAYNQLVNLVRIYKVDKVYAIYFCPKDKTTWVQKGVKPQNPFRSDREPCGIKIPSSK